MAKKHKARAGVTTATVRHNVRADIVAMAASVRRRIYHNPAGKTSVEILAEIGPTTAGTLATFLSTADSLATALAAASGQ